MLQYAALDTQIPLRVWEKLSADIATADLTPILDIEMAALPCVAWASLQGTPFDRRVWEALAIEAGTTHQKLREQLDTLAPNTANLFDIRNWDSPEQVKAAFTDLGITLESTDDDALAAVDPRLRRWSVSIGRPRSWGPPTAATGSSTLPRTGESTRTGSRSARTRQAG